MDTQTDETGPSEPQREKSMATKGALIGALVGGLVIGLLFYFSTLLMQSSFEGLIVAVGVILGIVQGASFGPLIALRFSKKW